MSTPPPETLGQLVLEYRKRIELTQEQLAECSGLSVRTIQDIECGKNPTPRKVTLESLANALKLLPQERSQLEALVSKAKAKQQASTSQPSNSLDTESPKTQEGTITITLSTLIISFKYKKLAIISLVSIVVLVIVLGPFPLLLEQLACHAPNVAGVVLYEQPCYQGQTLTLTESDFDLCDNPLDTTHGLVIECFSAPSWTDAPSSLWVGPGYQVEVHLHNSVMANDSMLVFNCKTAIPNLARKSFPTGDSANNNISRVVIEKTDCH